MPARFSFRTSIHPPAPVIPAKVSRLDRATDVEQWFLLDTGADRSIVPVELKNQLDLEEIERRIFEGLNGQRVSLPIVRLRLSIQGCRPLVLDAAVGAADSDPILGRDVSDLFRLTIDGPSQILNIE